MNLFSFFHFLSPYEGPFEKRVERFLRGIKTKSKADLEALVQEDLVRLSLFLEYKFKGYKKLKRRYRKILYQNVEALKLDFLNFSHTYPVQISSQKIAMSSLLSNDEPFRYLLSIMAYLKPGRILDYEASSTFEKLLRNPHQERLRGDCNQLVTLYIYLFSLKYEVHLLQVKILPDHVCLHYKGQDIETTNGQLADYQDYTFLSEVTEIVPVNLLDVPDPTEARFEIHPHNLFQLAQLAYRFSSHRPTVEHNLFAAYQNMAIFFAQKNDFSEAKAFANRSGNTRLQNQVLRMEGWYLLKQKKYSKALINFRHLKDSEAEKSCLQHELSDLLQKIKGLKTIDQFKRVKPILRRIRKLALHLNDQKILRSVDTLMHQL